MPTLFERHFPQASFAGVVFPYESVQTSGGHDVAEHVSYGRRGADLEATGQKPYEGSIRIPMLNGLRGWSDLFPGKYFELIEAFEATPIETLVHPTRGRFPAAILSWEEEVAPEVQNGLWLTVKWKEHLSTAQTVGVGIVTADAAEQTATRATTADSAMATAAPTGGYTLTSPTVSTQLTYLQAARRGYSEVQSATAAMLTVVRSNLSATAFATPAAYPAIAALIALRASINALRDRYQPTAGRERRYVVPRTASLSEIARDLYGNSARSTLLRAANDIPDALFVQAGTVLTVLPQE